MAATSQAERAGERERDLFALQQSQGVSFTLQSAPSFPTTPLEMVELFAAQSVKLWTKWNKSNNLYIDMIVSNGQHSSKPKSAIVEVVSEYPV